MALNVGDVVMVNQNRIEQVPENLWPEKDSLGVVRKILDSGEVLIERSIGLEKLRLLDDLDVSVGNTLAYREFEGIRGLVADSPIGVREPELLDDATADRYRVDLGGTDLDFDRFGGYQAVVARAKEIIETQLDRKQQLDEIGARPIKGVIFTGPPGTGKTLLARIIAAKSNADFFLVSGPSIVSKWVGESEEILRRIFEAAARANRAIVFFDEIDSLAEKRSGDTHEASKRLVAQLLTLMDGFDKSAGNVVVIAATNRIDVIDEALLRPGRFDWEIMFGMPTVSDRFEILAASMQGLSLSGEMPLEEIATRTDGWSAAKLASLWTEAALVTAMDARSSISAEDLALAFERVMLRVKA